MRSEENMKTYELLAIDKPNEIVENFTIITGEAAEIKSVYRSICKAAGRGVTELFPIFSDFPKFNSMKIYGIVIDSGKSHSREFQVVSADTVLRFMLSKHFTVVCETKN
jgi:hypothetical protein